MEKSNKYPRSVPYIIGNEAAERFSYYGMKSILPIFLIAQFFNPANNPDLQATAEAQASEATHFFIFIAYFSPVIGALLADWFVGKYRVILYVSIVYTIGHFMLSMFENWYGGFMFGLMVIAFCAGGIKSNVSANVGDQFDESNKHLISKVYSWFYFSINAGSVVSTLLIPWIYEHYGPSLAFGIPGVFMGLATLIYFMGNKKFVKVPPSGINKNNFMFINFYALYLLLRKAFDSSIQVWERTKSKFSEKGVDGIMAVWRVLAVFAFIPFFWALWDQSQISWVLQAQNMDRKISVFGLFEFEPLAAQIQSLNPFFILIFIPILNWLYEVVERKGIKVTPLRKIGVGLFLTALSFVFVAVAQEIIDGGTAASIWWQIIAFIILTLGEVMVSITGLEYAYTQAPISMKSTMTAFWLLTVSVGNLLVSAINGSIASGGFFANLTGATYFWFFAGLMTFILILFILLSGKIKEKSYIYN